MEPRSPANRELLQHGRAGTGPDRRRRAASELPGGRRIRAVRDVRQFPLTIRGWLLPDAPDADRGAFGRMLSAIAASATSGLPAPDISLVDLALMREWITGARQSDLVELRDRLEPNWTSPSDAPEIPDDLPRDPVEPI